MVLELRRFTRLADQLQVGGALPDDPAHLAQVDHGSFPMARSFRRMGEVAAAWAHRAGAPGSCSCQGAVAGPADHFRVIRENGPQRSRLSRGRESGVLASSSADTTRTGCPTGPGVTAAILTERALPSRPACQRQPSPCAWCASTGTLRLRCRPASSSRGQIRRTRCTSHCRRLL